MSDVLSDLLGAAATLTSLNLVFLGFIVTAFENDDAVQSGTRNRYRSLSVFSLLAFLVGLVCVAVCVIGLLPARTPHSLYDVGIVVFFTQLASLFILSVYAVVSIM